MRRFLRILLFVCVSVMLSFCFSSCKDKKVENEVSMSLYVGESCQLKTDASEPELVEWMSSDVVIVSVDETGYIVANAVGFADVVATYGDAKLTYKITVIEKDFVITDIIENQVYTVDLSCLKYSMALGSETEIVASVRLNNEKVADSVEWVVSSKEGMPVSYETAGNTLKLKAESVGDCLITAKKGMSEATCQIQVYSVAAQQLAFKPTVLGNQLVWAENENVTDYVISFDGANTWISLGNVTAYTFDETEFASYDCLLQAKGDGAQYYDSKIVAVTYKSIMYLEFTEDVFTFRPMTDENVVYDIYVNDAIVLENTAKTVFNRMDLNVLYGDYDVVVKAKAEGNVIKESNVVSVSFENDNVLVENIVDAKETADYVSQQEGSDADGDGKYWEVLTRNSNGIGENLLHLSGTTDYDWCPNGLFGKNNYSAYANKYIGMFVKVTQETVFALSGMSGSWTVATDANNAQLVEPSDEWTYIEFKLSNLKRNNWYITGISCNVSSALVLVDGIIVLNNPLKAQIEEEKTVDWNALDISQGLAVGNGRVVTITQDTDNDVIEDADGDAIYWQTMTSHNNAIDYNLFILSGANVADYANWCPGGLFGYNNYSSYATKKIGMYVKVESDITFKLGGMHGNWTKAYDDANAQTVTVEDGWKYIEFNLANLASGYDFVCGITVNVGSGVGVLVDGVKIFNTSYTDTDAINVAEFSTATAAQATPEKKIGKVADANGDGTSWQMYTSHTNGLGYNLFVLSGADIANYADWCPSGLFGYNNYSSYATKKIGMYVKVTSTVTFKLGGMNANWGCEFDDANAQTVTAADGWKYIEFDLVNLAPGYDFICGITVNVGYGVSVLVDGVKTFTLSYEENSALKWNNLLDVKEKLREPQKVSYNVTLSEDANGDDTYWEIMSDNNPKFGSYLLILSGDQENAQSVNGIFGKGEYSHYQELYIGMWVKVTKDTTFVMGGVTSEGVVGKDIDNAQTVSVEDGWTYVEFKLDDLDAAFHNYTAILMEEAGMVFIDGVSVYETSKLS